VFLQGQPHSSGFLSSNKVVASCKCCSTYFTCLGNSSLFSSRPGCVSAPALPCSLPSCATDAGSLLPGSDFSVPVISSCMRGAFSAEAVQVFSTGNIPSPGSGFCPSQVSSQREEPRAGPSAVQAFKSRTMYRKLQTGKLNIAHYSCLCSFINFYLQIELQL